LVERIESLLALLRSDTLHQAFLRAASKRPGARLSRVRLADLAF